MRQEMNGVLGLALLAFASAPAAADLKCGDAPYSLSNDTLTVSWVGPVPKTAKVSQVDGEVFEKLAVVNGSDIPDGYPEKYLKDLQRVGIANAYMSWDIDELTKWQRRHEIEMSPEPLAIFKSYLERGNLIFSALVEHPPVDDPPSFTACSVVLQRGVIVFSRGRESLFLRSYFHSTNGEDSANFVPSGGLEITFPSDGVWFPLELTKVIYEPASYVVLDVLTQEPLNGKQVPAPFQMGPQCWMAFGGEKLNATRLVATLEGGKDWPDLQIQP